MLGIICNNYKVRIWGVQVNNYDNTIKAHIGAVTKLLKYVGVNESDDIVIIDKPGIKNKQIEKYIKDIRRGLGMKKLDISLEKSEKEKGIQIVDAVAGSLSREFIPRDGKDSYFDLISSNLVKEVIKI